MFGLKFYFIIISAAFLALFSARVSPQRENGHAIVIDESVLKYLQAGYGGFGSSISWVVNIVRYSEYLFEGASIRPVVSATISTIALDSGWLYPYEFGGLAFCTGQSVGCDDAVRVLDLGVRRFPDYWRMKVYLVMALMERQVSADSLAAILLPISSERIPSPDYAKTLAFSLLEKGGQREKAIFAVCQAYSESQNGMLKLQLKQKLGNLIYRADVNIGADSTDFLNAVTSLLDSAPEQTGDVRQLVIRLVQPETKDAALQEARHLARQFRSFQAAQVGAPQ